MKTHYDTLQVSRVASEAVIRASYRTLMQQYHPDKFADPAEGTRIAAILNNAFATLIDPVRRSTYDAELDAADEEGGAAIRGAASSRGSPRATDGHPSQPDGPDVKTKTTTSLGLRWATWCIYFSYPLGALSWIILGATFMASARRDNSSLVGSLFVIIGLAQAVTAFQLRKSLLSGWKLNWAFVLLTYLSFVANFLAKGQSSDFVAGVVAAICGAAAWLWPNYIYWTKRRPLFSDSPPDNLPKQWGTLATVACVLAIGIPVLSAIALPAYQSYVTRSRLKMAATEQRALPESSGSPNVFDKFDPPQPKATSAANPGDPHAKPATEPNAETVRANTELAAEAAVAFQAHPFLDPRSTTFNEQAAEEVINRRDALIKNGMPSWVALREAVAEIAPKYVPQLPARTMTMLDMRAAASPITVNFSAAPVRSVLKILADVADKQLYLDPAVRGSGAFRYIEVPWGQVLADVTERYKLTVRVEGRAMYVRTAQQNRRDNDSGSVSRTATVKRPRCVIQSVMSDADIRACKDGE